MTFAVSDTLALFALGLTIWLCFLVVCIALGGAAKLGDFQIDQAVDRLLAGPELDEPAEVHRLPTRLALVGDEPEEDVDARLADVLRDSRLQVVRGGDDGASAA